MNRHTEFQKFNPFRRPDWRWTRIEQLVNRFPSRGRCSARDDDWIRLGRKFLCRWPSADDTVREQIIWERPGLYYAFLIYERRTIQPQPALFIEARLLAGQSCEYIANELSTLPDTIKCYEALFFNVAEYLQQRDWITTTILLPAILQQLDGGRPTTADDDNEEALPPPVPRTRRRLQPYSAVPVALPYLDASLKYFSYFGGPILADIMIHGMVSGRPLASQDDLSRWFDDAWSLTVKRRSLLTASQVEINKFTAMDLLATHARIIEIEKGDDTQESRRTSVERHVKAMLDDLPWQVGAEPVMENPALAAYKGAPGEPRDDELLAGVTVPPEEIMRALPPPRPRQAQPPASDSQSEFV